MNQKTVAEGVQALAPVKHLYVLPSLRTIKSFKQLQASEMEREASKPLFKKKTNSEATFHFDAI